jgi:hypothetical protein
MTTLTILEVTAPSMIVMGADGTAYEVRSRRHHRAGETVQVPVKATGTPDFSQAGWEEA